MRVTKSDISLNLECWVDELSPAQLAAYERVANEHNAVKNALKTALNSNEGKELFTGQVFQAYSFKGKVLQEIKEATLPPKKQPKAELPPSTPVGRGGRKRPSNLVYLESSDEEEDDVPLAKRIALAAGKKGASPAAQAATKQSLRQKNAGAIASSGKASPQLGKGAKAAAANAKSTTAPKSPATKAEKNSSQSNAPSPNFRPSEISSVGGLVIGRDAKESKEPKETNKEKLQGKTFPSLVVLAKPCLKVKDMSATRNKLDSKVKLVLMLTPNKFTEWLIQEGLLKAEQKCISHRSNELKLGVYSDASKFPYTGGYVWISECCPMRFVSVFHGSIFEGAPHPPSCILKLIYHWSCQTNIQNVVQWVKVDNVYIKGVYTWLRAVCTLAIHQKCKKLGGPEKFVEVGVISLGTTSQDGQQRQVKVEVLGVLDYADKTIRLRAVEPVSDVDRNYKKRFQTILEPLQRWVHKESVISIDLTVDKMTLHSMGFKNIVQAAATDSTAKHTNSTVMDYLRRIVPRMFQNTLSLLSRQMIQQFLDELVWREQFGTYALQAFNNITTHIAEQTRMGTNETLTQRLYQVATNPFKDWSVLPANYKEIPASTTPKRLKKPINEADYVQNVKPEKSSKTEKLEKVPTRAIKKEKERDITPTPPPGKRRAAAAAAAAVAVTVAAANQDEDYRPEKRNPQVKSATLKNSTATKTTANLLKKVPADVKPIKKEMDEFKGLEEFYYGIRDGNEMNFEKFPYDAADSATTVECPICDSSPSFDSNEKLQTHLVSHINVDGWDHQFQCLFCLDKHASESVLSKHSQIMHPTETKAAASASYHCLICQQRFNSLNYLTAHLQKIHNMMELPYCCQMCNYRSSSHRDVVRHFYDDHNNQNFLQCPMCLDVFRFSYKGKLNVPNIEIFFMHLRQHVGKKDPQMRCPKCALCFVHKGALKQHLGKHHSSMAKHSTNVRMLLDNSMYIPPPKVKNHHREPIQFSVHEKFGDFYAFIDGTICAECNQEIITEEHFPGELKCNKCNYKTCCERAMYQHISECNGATGVRDVMELPLPKEMHCICGFSTAIGNKMAQHLAMCGQKSAYSTHEKAQDNTVKRNMLDMLGLMRRDGEPEEQSTPLDSNVASGDSASSSVLDGSDQTPIPFGANEAAPILDVGQEEVASDTSTYQIEEEAQLHTAAHPQSQSQYHLGFGTQHATLTGNDIDMPLIGDLTDPHPSTSAHFLGEMHTPMFDAVAAAEQQHYQQLMQQEQSPPQHTE